MAFIEFRYNNGPTYHINHINLFGHFIIGPVYSWQRVPVTEKSGRVHTSAVSVAVLPQADEVAIRYNFFLAYSSQVCSSGQLHDYNSYKIVSSENAG